MPTDGPDGTDQSDNTGAGAQGVDAADLDAQNVQAESGEGAQGTAAADLDAQNSQAESGEGAQGVEASNLDDMNEQMESYGGFDSYSASELQEFNEGGMNIGGSDLMRDIGSWMRLALAPAQPDVNYNFIVSIGALPIGMFQSVEGIVIQHQPFQWKEGGRNHSPHYLPFAEPKNRGELSLKWGNVINDALYAWMRQVDVGNLIRKEVFVIQMGRHGWPNVFYRFAGCMPVYWEGAALNSGGSSWAIEELKIVYEHTVQVRTLIPTALAAAGVI